MHRGADTPIRSAISLVLWTALAVLCLALASPASAGTITVNSRDDTNQNDAVVTLRQVLVFPFAQDKPVDCPVAHSPDDVFANAVAAVGV